MKRIKLLELFAGIGTTRMGLENIGYEIDKDSEIVEWGVAPSIAYNVLHHDGKDNNVSPSKWIDYIGMASNNTKDLAKTIKNNKRIPFAGAVKNSKNSLDVTQYEIKTQFDLLTYSFPCQDLSNQGKQKGMSRDVKSRSGLLWEVERMLKNTEYKPKALLMENVKALVGKKNISDFQEWIQSLEDMGYKSEWKVLNSAHFGIGQNRERVFMISYHESVEDRDIKLQTFKDIKGNDYKTPFSDHMMSLEEIEESPWPLNENDSILNRYDLILSERGKYTLDLYTDFNSGCIVNAPHNEYKTLLTRDVYADRYAGGKVTMEGEVRMVRPLEKARLMGLTDDQFWKLYNHPALSTNEIEAMLGNAIVVDVLMEIFKTMDN